MVSCGWQDAIIDGVRSSTSNFQELVASFVGMCISSIEDVLMQRPAIGVHRRTELYTDFCASVAL